MLAIDVSPKRFNEDETIKALARGFTKLNVLLEQLQGLPPEEIRTLRSFGPLNVQPVDPIVYLERVRGQRERFSIDGIIEGGKIETYPYGAFGSGMILDGSRRLWRETIEFADREGAAAPISIRSVTVAIKLFNEAFLVRLDQLGPFKDLPPRVRSTRAWDPNPESK